MRECSLLCGLAACSFDGIHNPWRSKRRLNRLNGIFSVSQSQSLHWFLVRTKPHKERWVRDQLASTAQDVFLPLMKTRMRQWGRLNDAIVAMFPCYLFAYFD